MPLANEAVTIGRQQGNTIQLTEKNVSRRHARLVPEQDGWIIEDLGSYNGIKVNNDAIDGRTKLREGDVVEIGDYHLAITEDVDKSPLNFRTGGAANDGAAPEPMLVSSSTDLPRLSPDEIAALQSGRQSAIPAPGMLLDSGPVPAGQYQGAYGQPERRRNPGLLIFLGLALLGLVILGVFFAMGSGDDDSGEVATSRNGGGKGSTPAGAAATKAGAMPQPKPRADDDGADDAAVAEPTSAADDGTEVEAVDPADSGDDDGVEIDDGEEPTEIIDEPDPQPKPKNPQPKPKPKPKPNVDPDALLQEARDIQYNNPAAAYRKAKQAYAVQPSRGPLWVMGFAACRMKDKSKAQYVLKRLKGADRTKLKDNCSQKGLEL
ncbi:MAG: FHA domain-containing protein [Nannocystaceae bacterium]